MTSNPLHRVSFLKPLSSFVIFASWKSPKRYSLGHNNTRLPFNCKPLEVQTAQSQSFNTDLLFSLLLCQERLRLNVCLISIWSSYFHSFPLIKPSPAAVSSFLPPPSAVLGFSHWSAVGLENRPRAIANASIFGHVDGTRGMRLSHNPPSNTLPFLPPSNPSILSPPPLPSLWISSPAPSSFL